MHAEDPPAAPGIPPGVLAGWDYLGQVSGPDTDRWAADMDTYANVIRGAAV